jgi:phenylacetate-CoA ligase
MNPFLNPLFLFRVLKTYLFDLDRLYHLSDNDLEQYQSKRLREMVRFSDTVPLYYKKYKKYNVNPDEIKGINDIQKLPIVSKEDFQQHYPNGIISQSMKPEQLVNVATSGTTGKSLALYVDMFDIVMGLFGYLRTIREYGLSWWKNRLSIIGDFAPHTAESGYISRGLQPSIDITRLLKNIQWLNTNDPAEKIMDDLERFQPDFIGGYVGMLGHLALLKERGAGAHVHPRYIAATGSVLDPLLKSYIEEVFQTSVFEVYGATETGPIAFECTEGKYHVLSDLLYVEVQEDNNPAERGKGGHLVVTKLYGGGTPILRYNAINDIVALSDQQCTCGMAGELIQKIYGRDDLALYLPDGRVLLSSSFSDVYSQVLYKLKTRKMKDTQIIQHSLTDIEIQVVIDETLRKDEPSTDKIFSLLKQGFEQKVGSDVYVRVHGVDKVDRKGARIVSKVDLSTYHIRHYE